VKSFVPIALAGLAFAVPLPAAEDTLDRLGEALTFSNASGGVRLRVSGIIDAEYYDLALPAPGLLFTDQTTLFNPRLSLFADAQLGPRVYFFAQVRIDHGFDPNDENDVECRLDECALRVALGEGDHFSIQLGKFATVVGNWVPRHHSWENPFITAPVPYENLTGIWDVVAAHSWNQVLAWAHIRPPATPAGEHADKYFRMPIIWGPSYATGVALSGQVGNFDGSIEVKNAALASQPATWAPDPDQWRYPAVSARVGWRPNAMWNIGTSASTGPYLLRSADPTLAPGFDSGDYRQVVFGQDIGFAWHHWQLWAEWYANRFEIPQVGDARTVAWYVEAKYKFTPQFFGALRWNQQYFSSVPDGQGGETPWGRDLWRVDASGGYRFTPHVQLKAQYSFQHEERNEHAESHLIAVQLAVKF
jgi:hypothetical protein